MIARSCNPAGPWARRQREVLLAGTRFVILAAVLGATMLSSGAGSDHRAADDEIGETLYVAPEAVGRATGESAEWPPPRDSSQVF